MREVFEIRNSLDPIKIADSYSGGFGFGYRTRDARPPYPSKEAYLEATRSWLASIVHYRTEIDEIHTGVDGDMGIAWGLYHEEFQTRGGEPEIVRGRFSEVMKRDGSTWSTLFYHRDATPFDSRGVYAPVSKPEAAAGVAG
jgi:hypothetical protein